MAETQTEEFYEIHLSWPASARAAVGTRVYGPYAKPKNVKLALQNNRGFRYRLSNYPDASAKVVKVTRTYTDQVEEVEL